MPNRPKNDIQSELANPKYLGSWTWLFIYLFWIL